MPEILFFIVSCNDYIAFPLAKHLQFPIKSEIVYLKLNRKQFQGYSPEKMKTDISVYSHNSGQASAHSLKYVDVVFNLGGAHND